MAPLTARKPPDWSSMSAEEQSAYWTAVRDEARSLIAAGVDEHEVDRALSTHCPPDRKMRADITEAPRE